MTKINRRRFLEFVGAASATVPMHGVTAKIGNTKRLSSLPATRDDDFRTVRGFDAKVFLSWGDKINDSGATFGFNNDYIGMIPLAADRSLMMVNHEYPDTRFVHDGTAPSKIPGLADAIAWRRSVGVSILEVRQSEGSWSLVRDSRYNRRIDGMTKLPFADGLRVNGARAAVGTVSNCSGGVTPWGNFLTCEENYDDFYPDTPNLSEARYHSPAWADKLGFSSHHYGWVVEIDPKTGAAKKLTSMGRFKHEGALVVQAKDGRCVVYMGDDSVGQCIYKFVAAKRGSLDQGELFVADTKKGRWISLDLRKTKALREVYKTQLDVLIDAQKAALLVGGTPQDRPEGIARHPITGDFFISMTNNASAGNHHGSIVKLVEENADPLAMDFTFDTFVNGGPINGLSCPDNLVFDRHGGLWVTSDVSGSVIGEKAFAHFGNNALFYIPTSGLDAGEVYRIASAPRGAELTGPCFAPDQKSMFISVQHPGEKSHWKPELASHWPGGGSSVPKPSVVNVAGPAFEAILRA